MVSPCCGGEYSDHIDDEGYDVYICNNSRCEEIFTEPIEDYEYRQRMLDDIAEARADDARLGL